ncbi:hypothetical protein DFH06DRAFT_1140517 [Mycena polygramma]|nr:hypothetical protein DFH06DRAFT_1140517 [Mycena polygramma]
MRVAVWPSPQPLPLPRRTRKPLFSRLNVDSGIRRDRQAGAASPSHAASLTSTTTVSSLQVSPSHPWLAQFHVIYFWFKTVARFFFALVVLLTLNSYTLHWSCEWMSLVLVALQLSGRLHQVACPILVVMNFCGVKIRTNLDFSKSKLWPLLVREANLPGLLCIEWLSLVIPQQTRTSLALPDTVCPIQRNFAVRAFQLECKALPLHSTAQFVEFKSRTTQSECLRGFQIVLDWRSILLVRDGLPHEYQSQLNDFTRSRLVLNAARLKANCRIDAFKFPKYVHLRYVRSDNARSERPLWFLCSANHPVRARAREMEIRRHEALGRADAARLCANPPRRLVDSGFSALPTAPTARNVRLPRKERSRRTGSFCAFRRCCESHVIPALRALTARLRLATMPRTSDSPQRVRSSLRAAGTCAALPLRPRWSRPRLRAAMRVRVEGERGEGKEKEAGAHLVGSPPTAAHIGALVLPNTRRAGPNRRWESIERRRADGARIAETAAKGLRTEKRKRTKKEGRDAYLVAGALGRTVGDCVRGGMPRWRECDALLAAPQLANREVGEKEEKGRPIEVCAQLVSSASVSAATSRRARRADTVHTGNGAHSSSADGASATRKCSCGQVEGRGRKKKEGDKLADTDKGALGTGFVSDEEKKKGNAYLDQRRGSSRYIVAG